MKRLRVTAIAAALVFALFTLTWRSPLLGLLLRVAVPAIAALAAFSLLERRPRRLPGWLARWALQVIAAALVVPVCLLAFYLASTPAGAPPFWRDAERAGSFGALAFLGMLLASWIAMTALLRERDESIVQAERARGALEREALDARLRLLQAQVEPHFLFNTLANVQALVDAGSPQASPVLASLVAYLRAAVPRLSEPVHRLGRELEMASAYLTLMRLRLPDRLQFEVQVDPGLDAARCPPMTLLTLVENAVRHGIDPGIDGGRIDIRVRRLGDDRCLAEVEDSGVGVQATSAGLGTGLSTLRERLLLAFGGRAELRLNEISPHGVRAEVEFPIET